MSKLFALIFLLTLVMGAYSQNLEKAYSLNDRGMKSAKKGDLDDAINDFTQAIEISLMPGKKHNSQTSNLFNTASTTDEAALRDRVRILDPNTAKYYMNRGNVFMVRSELDKAINDFNEAIVNSPALAEAYQCRGIAWLQKKEFALAMADFEKALRIDPKMTEAHIGRALVHGELDEMQAAFQDFDTAIQLDPKNAQNYYFRGYMKQTKRDLDGAQTDFEQAINLNPKQATPYLGRGTLRMLKLDLEGAMQDLTKAIELDGRLASAYASRGYILLLLGKGNEAENDFRHAESIAPSMKGEIEFTQLRIKGLKIKDRSDKGKLAG
jgi:tetratricopeptide (TPR) repeat protein